MSRRDTGAADRVDAAGVTAQLDKIETRLLTSDPSGCDLATPVPIVSVRIGFLFGVRFASLVVGLVFTGVYSTDPIRESLGKPELLVGASRDDPR